MTEKSPSKKRKGTIRHEAFKKQQAELHKKSQRKVKIEYLKKARKTKFGTPKRKKKKKRQVGIRNIKGVTFLRGKIFHTRKKDAKRDQKIFQDRNHLARVVKGTDKVTKKKGYHLYYSEERIRKK